MNCPRNKKNLLFFFLFLNSPLLFAQQSDVGNWMMYFGNQAINDRWNWHNEIQYRNYNFAGDLEQLLLRTGIGYNLTENNNNLLLGYAYIHSQDYVPLLKDKTKSDEHRIFQQFINRHTVGRVHFQHRIRAEERFLPEGFKMRGRYFLSVNVPLNQPSMGKNTLFLSAYNEIFLNAQDDVFDRNRVYGALGYGLSKFVRIEAGFMSQILENRHRNQFQIGIYNNIPFSNN